MISINIDPCETNVIVYVESIWFFGVIQKGSIIQMDILEDHMPYIQRPKGSNVLRVSRVS